MDKGKRQSSIVLVFCMFLLLIGCEEKSDEYVFFASSEYVGEQLLGCLDKEGVKYKFDEKKDLLVIKTDSDKAIAYCS